jgi:hypothetical protein
MPVTAGETVPETIYDVSLESKSRREIPSTSFDQGKPMRILIDPPSRVYEGLPRYTRPDGKPISADEARKSRGLLSEVEIVPQTIYPGQSLAFVVGNRGPISIRVVDAPLRVAIRRRRKRRHRGTGEGVRDTAWVVVGLIAFVMAIASIFD